MDAQHATQLLGWAVPEGWAFEEITRGGYLAAFVLVKGSEVHVNRLPEYAGRWLGRKDLERIGAPLIAKYGHITTAVMKKNKAGQAFVERLGFRQTHELNGIVHYRTEEIKHARH